MQKKNTRQNKRGKKQEMAVKYLAPADWVIFGEILKVGSG